MFAVNSAKLRKTATISPDIQIKTTNVEEEIFTFLRDAAKQVPRLSGGKYPIPTVRVAGGWVRDNLLNRQSKDIDITVDNGMTGVEFGNILQLYDAERQSSGLQTGFKFGGSSEARPEQSKHLEVLFARLRGTDENGRSVWQEVEVMNTRDEPEEKDLYTPGNRTLTQNIVGTAEQDAFRRDLTINSLFFNINEAKNPNRSPIEDWTGRGFDDLSTMTLDTPREPKRILRDDPLRVLRILRFNGRFKGAKIADHVIDAMADPEIQHQLTRRIKSAGDQEGIVPERTAIELRKILTGEQPEESLRLMHRLGLLRKILNLPEHFESMDMDQRNPHHEFNMIEHTIRVVGNANKLSTEMGLSDDERMMMNLSSLWHDIGKLDPSIRTEDDKGSHYGGHEKVSADLFKRFSQSLKLTKDEQKFVHDVVLGHMRPHDQMGWDMSRLNKYKDQNKNWKFHYIHAMADVMSKSSSPNDEEADQYRSQMKRMDQWELPVLVSGNEIKEIIGKPAGPFIGQLMQEIRRAQYKNFGHPLDQPLSFDQARAEALEVVKKHAPTPLRGDEIAQLIGVQGPDIGRALQDLRNAHAVTPMSRDEAVNFIMNWASNL